MDVVAVRGLAAELRRASDRFRQAGTDVTNGVAASWWQGPDAEQFRRAWSGRRVTLQDAATALSEMRELLMRQARDQEIASDATGTPVAAAQTTAIFGPLDEVVTRARAGIDDLVELLRGAGTDAVRWLDWLSGPEGPSIEDLTARKPGLQGDIGETIDSGMRNRNFAAAVNWAFGFRYVPGKDDFYTTGEQSLQSHLGFHDVYDKLHKLGNMDLRDEVFEFEANGKQYRLELWKGGYLAGSSFGGEIGLYTRREDSTLLRGLLEKIPGYYSSAQGEDQIKMTQTIYNKHTGEKYFTNHGKGAADGDHYWNLAIRSEPGIRHEDLGQRGTLHVPDPEMRTKMAEAMRQQGLKPDVDDKAGTVSYDWKD